MRDNIQQNLHEEMEGTRKEGIKLIQLRRGQT